jgi:hypothetical protein
MHFKLLGMWEDEDGLLFVTWQKECTKGEVMNRISGPFIPDHGEEPWELLRVWLAAHAYES